MTATMAVAVCLPLTYSLGLHEGLALLLGLYVGGISGGLVPAILLNIPGTPSSITTTFDGHPMARRGEAERALKICIVASLVGGLFSAAILFLFAPVLSDFAIKFSYVEKFLIIFFALTVIASLSKNMLIGIFSGLIGVFLSLIGTYDVGALLDEGTRLLDDIPPGHKVSLTDLAVDAAVIRYGEVIGYALEPIARGRWISETLVRLRRRHQCATPFIC